MMYKYVYTYYNNKLKTLLNVDFYPRLKVWFYKFNPRLPKRGGYQPLRIFSRLLKLSAIKLLQLIVGSSFAVILAKKFDHPTLGRGRVGCQS